MHIEHTPSGIARFNRFEHGRRHREDAGIAARDKRDLPSLRGAPQRLARALQLDAIVAGKARLPLALRQPRHIGRIANEILRRLQGPARILGQITGIAGPKTDDVKAALLGVHGRRPCPGASTIAK